MKRWIKRLFGKKRQQTTVLRGGIWEINNQYGDLVRENVRIIATALSQDFERYGNTEKFVLIVTYIRY